MSRPLATLLVETTELVASATERHHQNQQQHTSCRSSASSLFLRADGPLPLLLCWIVSLVVFVAETTSTSAAAGEAAGEAAGAAGRPIMSWMSNKMMSERISWCLIQILLLFFAMVINICFHLRIDNTQFTQRKRCVERFILQLHASSSSSSSALPDTNNAATAPIASRRSESNGEARTMWNLKANSASVVSTYRQGVWRLVPANLLVKVCWKQFLFLLFFLFFSVLVNSAHVFCSPVSQCLFV